MLHREEAGASKVFHIDRQRWAEPNDCAEGVLDCLSDNPPQIFSQALSIPSCEHSDMFHIYFKLPLEGHGQGAGLISGTLGQYELRGQKKIKTR